MASLPHPDLIDHDSYSESGSDDGQDALDGGENQLLEPVTQPQRRKGGRKPIYSTVEERKQRNRQAQAAFRDRRTEYIKQLEATLKEKEDQLQALQNEQTVNHSQCSSLRYTIQVMEGIMLEHGIDVESEMRARGGSRGRISSGSSTSPQVNNHGASLPIQHHLNSQTPGSGVGAKPKPLKAKIAQLSGGNISTKMESSHMPTPPWQQNAPSPQSLAPSPAVDHSQTDQAHMRQAYAYDPHHQRTSSGAGLPHANLVTPTEPAYVISHGRSFSQGGIDQGARNHPGGPGYGHPSVNYANPNGPNTLGKLPPSLDPFYMKELCPS